MYTLVFQILILFFGLSLLPIFYIIIFKQKGNISLLLKYSIYLALAFGSIYIIQMGFALSWAFVIVLIGLFEMLLHIKLYNKNKLLPLIVYLLFAINLVMVIYMQAGLSNNYNNILYVYTLVLVFDGMSQLGGQILGSRKLTPYISPNKTMEGFITGLLFCYVASIAVQMQMPNAFPNYLFWISPLLISLSALCGDLLASSFKRACGIKDFSNLLPGHGGILDRFDGVMGAAVVIWLFL